MVRVIKLICKLIQLKDIFLSGLTKLYFFYTIQREYMLSVVIMCH